MKLTAIFLACALSMALTACGQVDTMADPSIKIPTEESYGYTGEFSDNAGSNGITGGIGAAGAASAWSETAIEEAEPTASWSLMMKHGQYLATNKGKVYPYGESGFLSHSENTLWDEAKDSLDEAGKDLNDAFDEIDRK